MRKRVQAGVVLMGLAVLLLGPGWVWAGESHDFHVTDPDGIYYGEGKYPKTPAVTKADDVWAVIPEYKRIVDEDLDEDDPKYHILMMKATERFEKALKKVAEREGYDMIGEVGAIEAKGENKKEIPDITKALIKVVERD